MIYPDKPSVEFMKRYEAEIDSICREASVVLDELPPSVSFHLCFIAFVKAFSDALSESFEEEKEP